MEKLGGVLQKRLKPQKAKMKQVKIVQISNPLKLTATTSEFKGLVQELTGLESDMSLHGKYVAAAAAEELLAASHVAGGVSTAANRCIEDRCSTNCGVAENNFEVFDEILASPMIVDRADFIPISCYDNSSFGNYAESVDAPGW